MCVMTKKAATILRLGVRVTTDPLRRRGREQARERRKQRAIGWPQQASSFLPSEHRLLMA
jgi:hypothetical protein